MDNTNSITAAKMMLERAAKLLKKNSLNCGSIPPDDEVYALIQQLSVHQIELEMINDELQSAKDDLERISKKYVELYDFAPIGYFSINKEGQIVDLNLSAASLLGKERSRLKNSNFGFFVSESSKPIFNLFIEKAFSCNSKESCEVILTTNENLPVHVYLTGIVSENREECYLTAIDITEPKHSEEELIKARELAEESDRLKSAFLANMTHKIKTQMKDILVTSELLKAPDLSGEQQQYYIRLIENSGNHMLDFIKDIISKSKVESGQMDGSISETDINQ
jgi:PAS domain S-box-containing protein